MPPHIIKRKDAGGNYYLIDGPLSRSLKTPVKSHALELLDQYIKGKLRLGQGVTVGQYYDPWIERKEKDATLRKSLKTSYRQHFNCYILSEFRHVALTSMRVERLSTFRANLLASGISLKTVRNILDGSFRALWKDARREGLVDDNPFELLDWPAYHRPPPDPYTIEERDAIIAWVGKHEPFYYPWV